MPSQRNVLSIQSHVVSGCVGTLAPLTPGNKAAVFPLNLLGFSVDPINTVQFSNHTGYPCVKGTKLSGDQLDDLLYGLRQNDLVSHYSHVLTGYIGTETVLLSIKSLISSLRAAGSPVIFVLDPVMGDNDYLYVSPALVPIYRELVPLASIVTPNKFELQLLTERPTILSVEEAFSALEFLHQRGVPVCILTSLESDTDAQTLCLLGSVVANGNCRRFSIQFPKVNFNFTGTGDLMSALLLAHIDKDLSFTNIVSACEKSIASVQAALRNTVDHVESTVGLERYETLGRHEKMRLRELRIIQSKDELDHPKVLYKAAFL